MLEQIWQYKLQIAPVVLFLALFELPALIRKMRKTFYVPIYFTVYPLRQINQDLSTYLGEDDIYDIGRRLKATQAEALRKKIITTACVSAAIDTFAIPLAIGFIAAFLLDKAVFHQFLIIIVFYKFVTITLSLRNSHLHILDSKWKYTMLISIYFTYIGLVAEMLRSSYNWALPFISKSDWIGLLSSFSEFFFGKILAQSIAFAIFVAIFTNFITDRQLREKNVSHDE